MARITAEQAGGDNVVAFLDMLAVSEIGARMLADSATDDGYRVLVGSTPKRLILFSDYRDHPIPDDAHAIQVRPGLKSTAAGRYQILNTYWPHYKAQLGLPDFGPRSQDHYALKQIAEQRALDHVRAGRVRRAISCCSNIWASLPGAGYGQHEHRMSELVRAFKNAGGIVHE